MVAYSFHKTFVPQVQALSKHQTVRGPRKRHARPGEPVQLYTAMRTRHCRKLVDPDPVCSRVDDIRIETSEQHAAPDGPTGVIEAIEINGIPLDYDEIEAFAIADGFAPLMHDPPSKDFVWKDWVTARVLMGTYWLGMHEPGQFEGVVVHWGGRAA